MKSLSGFYKRTRKVKRPISSIDNDIAYWERLAETSGTQAWLLFLGISFGLKLAKLQWSPSDQHPKVPVQDFQI